MVCTGCVAGVRSLSSAELDDDEPRLAYEMVQGPLARWTKRVPGQAPPTAVLVHGILGRRQNMQSFARMLAQGFPAWQILLVDMRCHGESAGLANRPDGPHTVHSAAKDILLLLRELKLFPHVLIGHSFGGKVVMSMVEVFGTSQLPRPLQVRG
ncbi:AB hydrolase-1 domain-containing protein [Haematococcus lacustris]|uniref:AB hydrolase-1 domain-containing protein n=1 Tax=Haematococcus lacustris TaxID=44745 RepID=A0A699YVH4_HAELA|nr:AB hydrolase-1 domain-containing protein [Haematococcus lacustris]